jgi:5,10-methylenetetrahydromethanopterin reductase
VQVFKHLFPVPGRCVPAAVAAEAAGFDGVLLADSQNLVGDPFVELGRIAAATTALRMGTGTVNPVTRHPAVVAGAIATVHAESAGRAVLGVGRGDSSLAQLGEPPARTAQLLAFVDQVRGYLRGELVQRNGSESRIGWIGGLGLPPVEVELTVTGPAGIAAAATRSDRVMLTVGAEPDRIAASVELARKARAAAGLDPAGLRVGAYLNVGVHPDPAVACGLVRGSTAIFAHFGSMSAASRAAVSAESAAVIGALGRAYDEARHGLSTAGHVTTLDDDFVRRFAVAGPPAECTARLRELIGLGLDRIVVVAGSRDADPDLLADTDSRFEHEVLPALR